MTDRVGQQLGNYQIVSLLGRGGFAEVYLGEHVYLKTKAAIKVLHAQLAKDDMDGFIKEARTIANLVHPNIVRVLEFGVQDSTPFLVLDYAPNGSLRERHPRGTHVPLTNITSYVKQVAAALQYAHNEKLVHRDVKPENMLLGRYNDVLLSDFGIALIAQSTHYQGNQDITGTVAYMAPEQIQGQPRPASDQYSLGIVVYEWLSGDLPFHGSFTEICTQQLMVPPPSLREQVPTISPEVEQVVMTALAKDPKERFGTVQAFACALEEASRSEQARAVETPAETRAAMQPALALVAPSAAPGPIRPLVPTADLDVTPAKWEDLCPQPSLSASMPAQPAPRPRRNLLVFSVIGVIVLALVLGSILAVSASLNRPQAAPSTTTTPHATTPSTPRTNATATPNLAALSPQQLYATVVLGRQPTLTDPLSAQNNNQWDQNATWDNNQWDNNRWGQNATCAYRNGTYQITNNATGSYQPCMARNTRLNFANFAYQVKMTILSGTGGGGLIFRSDTAVTTFTATPWITLASIS